VTRCRVCLFHAPRRAAGLLLLIFSAWPAAAQELRDGPGGEPALLVPRIQGPSELTGNPDGPGWAGAAVLEGVMHLPDFGAEPTQTSEFLIGHDGQYLYFACRSYESDPSLIRVTSLRRNWSGYDTDSCGIRLDTFNDEENSVAFNTSPVGNRSDMSFANDAAGPPNSDWNTFWDAAGTFTEWGWAAEMRIPFSSLGFQVIDDRVVMGFAVGRTITRDNEVIIHPAIPPNWGPGSIVKPSQMRKMILEGVSETQPVYVTPYGLAGRGRTHALDGAGTQWNSITDDVFEGGVDLRYGVTRNLQLDLTFNTDFAQVEADDQQVNLTRFSLFFPEKRRFFQERAAIFEFPLGFQERLFHSRRIGLVEGQPVRIYGGGRLVGRIGEWDVGLLNMQTAGEGDTSSENAGVIRLRRRVLNPFSYVGGIVTTRIGAGGRYNVLYGTDGVFRMFGQDYLMVNWAQTFDDREDAGAFGSIGVFDRGLVRMVWERRGTDGVTYQAAVTRVGEAFEPGLGFLFRRDYMSGNARLGYGWRPGSGSRLNRYGVSIRGTAFRRNADRTVETASGTLQGELETRGGHRLSLEGSHDHEDLASDFFLATDAWVPAGTHRFTAAILNYNPPMGAVVQWGFRLQGGQFFDGTRVSARISPNWRASRHLNLGGFYELNRIQFGERDQTFTAHITRLRSEIMFTTTLTLDAFVQYSNTADRVDANIRFRYNPREGDDLYIVWNETVNSDRFAADPALPRSQGRTFVVKYSRTFTLER